MYKNLKQSVHESTCLVENITILSYYQTRPTTHFVCCTYLLNGFLCPQPNF
ncbi:hypothetical protein HanRHA438_Chr10g0446841 [Helianthus annuus]|nr:hypothetical protein HanIR_Chr10g0468661 [Helianthus annuus]KAJ0879047.1 hypothetical protein HanRHA438_Chr10g0446841 [Helianthus annuus]